MNNKINIIKYIEVFYKNEKNLNIKIENINSTQIINGNILIDFNYFPENGECFIYDDDDDDDDGWDPLVENEIIYLGIIF